MAIKKNPSACYETPDPTPMALPVNYSHPPTLRDQIRQMVRSERLAQAARDCGAETFEEADDFDVGDDLDPKSPYEEVFDPAEAPQVSAQLAAAERALLASSEAASPPAPAPSAAAKKE